MSMSVAFLWRGKTVPNGKRPSRRSSMRLKLAALAHACTDRNATSDIKAMTARVNVKCLSCGQEASHETSDTTSIAKLSRGLVCWDCGSRAMIARREVQPAERPVKHG